VTKCYDSTEQILMKEGIKTAQFTLVFGGDWSHA